MDKKLKIVSYNIHKSLKTKTLVKNIQKIAASGASIICLQEVRRSLHNNKFIVDEIMAELGSTWQAHSFLSLEEDSFDYGLAMLWNLEHLKATKFEKLELPLLKMPNPVWQFLQLLYHGKPGPHLRGTLIGTFSDRQGKKIRISNVHLDWQGKLEHRIGQIKFLKNKLDEYEDVHCEVICGDFNTIGLRNKKKQKQINIIADILGDQFKNSNPELDATTAIYPQALDHIFVKGFGLHEDGVYKLRGSDHYPVMVTVAEN